MVSVSCLKQTFSRSRFEQTFSRTYPCPLYSFLYRRAAYLPGKIVWITGASSGLGEQLAISAAAGGAAGLILSGRREDALDRVKKACEETAATCHKGSSKREGGVRVEVLPFDVADLEFAEREAAARAVQLFGSVDALVLNAGVSYLKHACV